MAEISRFEKKIKIMFEKNVWKSNFFDKEQLVNLLTENLFDKIILTKSKKKDLAKN